MAHRANTIAYKQLVDKKGVRSPVWSYFGLPAGDDGKPVQADIAICKLCKNQLVMRGGSTSSLVNHIKGMHSAEFLSMRRAESGASSTARDTSAATAASDDELPELDAVTQSATEHVDTRDRRSLESPARFAYIICSVKIY
jgi:hypothetical protein